jgi:membrane protease YdiL (CAAX protease family)
LKEIAKIFAYLVAVVLLAAALAPPLYWAGQAVAARGVMPFLAETDFQKFFNRAALIAAIALLWPTIRWLRIAGWRDFGLLPDPRWKQHLLVGFLIAAAFVAAMAGAYVAMGVYKFKAVLPWGHLPKLMLSAVVVSILEEALFRGAILGLFRRAAPVGVALFCTTFLFAAVHFLKPDDDVEITTVTWTSGFALLPHTFHQFTNPMMLLAGFTTLFVLGWVLGLATVRTHALWMSIGLHIGVIFVKMGFSKFTKRQEEYLPWIGRELQIGLVPVLVLALAGLAVLLWLKYEARPAPKQHPSPS